MCKTCHEIINGIVISETKQMISDGVSKEDIVRNITAKYAQTAHGKKYLVNYLATKWLTNDFQRMDQQRLIQLQESGETIKITTG